MLKVKAKIAGIHFLISLILAFICALLVFYIIYPYPLAQAIGATSLFLIILSIDLILGPLLTFIVYKKDKKTLKIDLFIIAMIQLMALSYGIYSMYQGRPVWIAYTVDRFELIRANDVVGESEQYPLPLLGVEYVFVQIDTEKPSDQLKLMLQEVQYRISPAQQPQYYNTIEKGRHLIIKNAMDINYLEEYNSKDIVENTRLSYPLADAFLPLQANEKDMTVLINKATGKVVNIVNLRPW